MKRDAGQFAIAAVVLTLAGCRASAPVPSGRPLPPNTVRLSTLMRTLSEKPGFTEAFLKQVEGGSRKAGAALLTPRLVDRLRELTLGKDWQGLDRFPGWTMRSINPTVRVVGHLAAGDRSLNALATTGGAPARAAAAAGAFVDLGSFSLSSGGDALLDRPTYGPGFSAANTISMLGAGVTRGDGPNPALAPYHAESQRLADVLNRLSLNGLEGVPVFRARIGARAATTPQELMAALAAAGNTVEVVDARYFANFGHLHWNGQDVMMPFWLNTQIVVPHGWTEARRALLVPVSHAEYEWRVTGPAFDAAVSFYFGIDGKAEWRTMDQLDQAWVMSRRAHIYPGAQGIEVTRLAAAELLAYEHLHQAHPALPFGGYYALGVCQDVVAAIELKMTGKTTLFPNTADAAFFTDPRDAEVNGLIRRLPKDRDGHPPEVERIFGSLPVGDSEAELAGVSIPGLGPELVAVHAAWSDGTLERTGGRWERGRRLVVPVGLALAALLLGWLWWRRSRDS